MSTCKAPLLWANKQFVLSEFPIPIQIGPKKGPRATPTAHNNTACQMKHSVSSQPDVSRAQECRLKASGCVSASFYGCMMRPSIAE
jgi:hypothetical protein